MLTLDRECVMDLVSVVRVGISDARECLERQCVCVCVCVCLHAAGPDTVGG